MESHSLPQASLASQQALLESSEGQTTTAGSGLRLLRSYTPFVQHGSSLKMCLESLLLRRVWHSSICALRWKASATRFNRLLFRLVPSMPDTEGTEFGLWPTPTSRDHKDAGENLLDSQIRQNGHDRKDKLGYAVKMWPTPTANEDACGKSTGKMQAMLGNHPALGKTSVSGSLNPAWVEWLMGYPTGHTDCADWGTPSSRRLRLKSSAPSDPSKNPNPSNHPNENQTKIRG